METNSEKMHLLRQNKAMSGNGYLLNDDCYLWTTAMFFVYMWAEQMQQTKVNIYIEENFLALEQHLIGK